jgi:2-oxoglutarate ferredoxin oxidoreductase subunit alpha
MAQKLNRLSIRFVGESGQGINTLGELASKALKNSNYYTFAYREYPSLIRGGVASYQIDIASKPINSSSKFCDILISLDEDAFEYYIKTANDNSVVIYDDKQIEENAEISNLLKQKNINSAYIPTVELAEKAGGTPIMANMVLLGVLWNILGLEINSLEELVRETFKDKNIDLDAEVRCIEEGKNGNWKLQLEHIPNISEQELKDNKIITGNEAIALGLISGGLRAYYAYPMTPATSILKYLGNTYKETEILIKQAESEITAAQMVLGSMYAGTRAATATSGGGFDLMTESISCAGITETPFLVILAQRAGAGTGVPTWTGAGDLTAAVNAGHGEFPRCVISVSDPKSAYTLTQEALNITEKYQLPVILLTEKQIAESLYSIRELPEPIKIDRGKISDTNTPYKITEDGISPRPIPSKVADPFLRSSDEHTEDGVSTEISEEILQMTEKRKKKLETLTKEIPEPKIYGKKDANTVFVGWGSVKTPVIDCIEDSNLDIAYLHYEYIYPLKTEFFKQIVEKGKEIILIENNETGELGKLLSENTGYEFNQKLLKSDGRPIFIEDILEFLSK